MTGYVPMQWSEEKRKMEFIPTKTALKAMVKTGVKLPVINPNHYDEYHRAVAETVAIVGPDPYKNRKWYATVTVDHEGFIVKVK